MNTKHTFTLTAVATLLLALLVPPVVAQDAPLIDELLAKLSISLYNKEGAFTRIHHVVTVNGEKHGDDTQEIWSRGIGEFRVEKDDGTIMVFTPTSINLFHGPSNVVLSIPEETLKKLGDERDAALGNVGIGMPSQLFDAVNKVKTGWSLTGEDNIGEDCWVITLSPEGIIEWNKAAQGPTKATMVQISVGKETGLFRGMYMALEGEANIEIGVSVPEVEVGIEVTDDELVFEAPNGAKKLTWTADKTAEQMGKEFRDALTAAMQQ